MNFLLGNTSLLKTVFLHISWTGQLGDSWGSYQHGAQLQDPLVVPPTQNRWCSFPAVGASIPSLHPSCFFIRNSLVCAVMSHRSSISRCQSSLTRFKLPDVNLRTLISFNSMHSFPHKKVGSTHAECRGKKAASMFISQTSLPGGLILAFGYLLRRHCFAQDIWNWD